MLHLLPIRSILGLAVSLAALGVLATVYTGWIGGGEFVHDATQLMRWSSSVAMTLIIGLFAVWRWVPPVQRMIFPYLGGAWSGFVRYDDGDREQRRKVTLEVKHTLFGLRLLLDSKESTSWTVLVHAERNPDFERYRLYYVYLNERKEGFENAGQRYRGLAVIRIEPGPSLGLIGDYFTETHRHGTLHLTLDALHPWWKLWR
jgi:SMODS-associating 2TM, beta-strand rich effector domain